MSPSRPLRALLAALAEWGRFLAAVAAVQILQGRAQAARSPAVT